VPADHGFAEVANGGAKAGKDGREEHVLKGLELGFVEFDDIFGLHARAFQQEV
jgi:hypothetical protein